MGGIFYRTFLLLARNINILIWVCSVISDSYDPMVCSPPCFSIHGIFQAQILECVAISYSRGSPQFSSVQSLSRVWLFATPWIAARQASLFITNSRGSPRLTSIESVMPSSHLILCRPLLLLPPIPPSIRVFSNESTLCMGWPKYLFHICYWWSTGNQIVVLEEYSWDGSATYDM